MCTAKSLNQHKLTSVFGHGQYVGTLFTQIAEARFVERTWGLALDVLWLEEITENSLFSLNLRREEILWWHSTNAAE